MYVLKLARDGWLLAASLTVAACTLPGSSVPLTNPPLIATSLVLATCALPAIGTPLTNPPLIATSLVLATCALPAIGTPLANPFPRSFTDDPFVDDEKFIEIGKCNPRFFLIILKVVFDFVEPGMTYLSKKTVANLPHI
jgi:hypothetical protein